MSAIGSILSGLGAVASVTYPQAVPIIAFLQKIEPYAEAALPIIQAGIKEGPTAFAAAREAAPEFFASLYDLAASLKLGLDPNSPVNDDELVDLTAHIVGVDPPGWTHADTERWWDRAQAQG